MWHRVPMLEERRFGSIEENPMTTYTLTTTADLGPVLVSDLPAASAPRRSLLTRVREDLVARREARAFDRAVRFAGHSELGDLMAAHRRD